MIRAALLASLLFTAPAFAADPPKITLKDGDRIVYLGNTFAERDANYGYLETLLTIHHPDVNFTFRNLGWSGDTVWGDARARFGTRADGFKHLKEHVLALKPTIILVAYGMNESFAGEAGLKEFEKGLNTLLDTLAESRAKMVLISPIPHEKLDPPLPNPAKHNMDLRRYRDAMARVAEERKTLFVDLLDSFDPVAVRMFPNSPFYHSTADGIHPTEYGLFLWGQSIAERVFDVTKHSISPRLRIDRNGEAQLSGALTSTTIERTNQAIRIVGVPQTLPNPLAPTYRQPPNLPFQGGYIFILQKPGLEDYLLRIDNAIPLKFTNANRNIKVEALTGSISASVDVQIGPEIDQVEKLRALINRKNELYFHRWRPQNETYLFGFRKHEQGNNAVEIPKFDPLVAELEAQINVLKKPVKHTYEIIREEAVK